MGTAFAMALLLDLKLGLGRIRLNSLGGNFSTLFNSHSLIAEVFLAFRFDGDAIFKLLNVGGGNPIAWFEATDYLITAALLSA